MQDRPSPHQRRPPPQLCSFNRDAFRKNDMLEGFFHGPSDSCGRPVEKCMKHCVAGVTVITFAAVFFKGRKALQETGQVLGAFALYGR